MLLFFLVSPIRNRFFFESIWKKNCFFFYQTRFERDALSSPRFHKQYRKCNTDSLSASSAQESYFSQGDTKNYSFALFITILCTNIYIYIYIIRTSVSQFLRESKREDRSGLIIVKGISNWSSCRNWKLRGFSGKFSLCTSSFHRGYGRYVARGNSHPPPLI